MAIKRTAISVKMLRMLEVRIVAEWAAQAIWFTVRNFAGVLYESLG